jgi:ABC-2 type transport system permease protein
MSFDNFWRDIKKELLLTPNLWCFGRMEISMFQIIIKETKDFIRDKTNLFFFLLFPVVLIFLLGSLLSSADKAEEAIGTISIHYRIDTKNEYQKAVAMSFIQEVSNNNKSLLFEETKELDASRELAGRDEITAVVHFTGDPMEIKIYEGRNQVKNRAVNAVMNGFIQMNKAMTSVISSGANVQSIPDVTNTNYIEHKNLGIERTMIDYYAVSMLAMICFMSMLVGAGAFLGERQNKTINRLIIAPQNRILMFLQKILGMIPQVVLQIIIIMITSVVIFKANYAVTLRDNLHLFTMFFAVTLCMVSLGAVLGMIIKLNPMVVIMPVLWLMMFFGGTYSKEMKIKGLTEAMPIYQIQQAAFDLALFGRGQKANHVILLCVAIMIVALILGAFLFSKKQEER